MALWQHDGIVIEADRWFDARAVMRSIAGDAANIEAVTKPVAMREFYRVVYVGSAARTPSTLERRVEKLL